MRARALAERLAARAGATVRKDGSGGYLVPCPAHEDDDPSLHVSEGERQAVLVHCHAGCATFEVLAAAGLGWTDLCNERVDSIWSGPTEEYPYLDAAGAHLFTVARAGHGEGKRFCAYRFGDDGQVIRDARTMPRLLYRLPEVISAVRVGETIYLCEGEKDADVLRSAFGVTATTNPFGGCAWASHADLYAGPLRGARVTVVEDYDAAGRRRTRQILASLTGVAAELQVVRAAAGSDAFDHVVAGLGLEELVGLPEHELALCDDGSFAGLPHVFFEAAGACNLAHLDYRVLTEIARQSVRREDRATQWQPISCPSSWLAKCCGNASPSAVRRSMRRLRVAGLLLEEHAGSSTSRQGSALNLRVNADYRAWRSLIRGAASSASRLSSAGTAPDSCRDTNTREDLGVREGRERRKG